MAGRFRLLLMDRRGYGRSPDAGERFPSDYLADADDIAELLGDGAHLVGHSYGGVGAMIAGRSPPRRGARTGVLGGRDPARRAAGGRVPQAGGLWDVGERARAVPRARGRPAHGLRPHHRGTHRRPSHGGLRRRPLPPGGRAGDAERPARRILGPRRLIGAPDPIGAVA
ncbi:alpha/beta fold hydrolase [Nonomuraea sp. KM88]|uniref:alpha/beta fold hydrolase n=1 Tax=Nonomuraea sp. KM88 TaxID=3457427 RepID=UPI003FCD75F3